MGYTVAQARILTCHFFAGMALSQRSEQARKWQGGCSGWEEQPVPLQNLCRRECTITYLWVL